MKRNALYFCTLILIAAFPFGNHFFQVFRGLSVSFFHLFERVAPFTVTLPPLFQKYIHFYVTDVWIVGLLAGAFFLKEVRFKELFFNRHSRYLTFYTGIAFLSILTSVFSRYLFQYVTLLNFALACSVFHLIYALFSKEKEWIPKALWFFVGVAALECAIGIGQFLLQHSLGLSFLSEAQVNPSMDNIAVYPLTEGSRLLFDKLPWIHGEHSSVLRAYGTFDHPNIFGGYLVVALFVSYFLFTESETALKKGLILTLIPFLILTLALTFARGPFFAWVLGTLLFFGGGIYLKNRRMTQLGGIIAAAMVIIALLLFEQFAARGGFVNYNTLSGASDSGRILLYRLAFSLALHHPFLGIGYNGFALFPYETVDPAFAGANGVGTLAHNIYLQLASETGLLGLGVVLLFFSSFIFPAFKQKLTPLSLTLFTILFSLLLIGMVDHFLWVYNAGRLLLFIFSGLFAAYVKARECPSPSQSKYGVRA